MFLISLDTSAVFMWCCIIRGSGSFRNTAGLSLVNRLHSVKRCWAVCSAFFQPVKASYTNLTVNVYRSMLDKDEYKYNRELPYFHVCFNQSNIVMPNLQFLKQ